ncbi:hypothetical protein MSPP1_003303 [Malassezia sp. CBS 17886]|nr:hypothetical protein MSPP1_003303 [Malassezia sp. CBS 17886]
MEWEPTTGAGIAAGMERALPHMLGAPVKELAPLNKDSGAPGRPIRRRNRQPLSCIACRDRKIRCDHTVPCSQCIRRGVAEQCAIENRARPSAAPVRRSAPAGDAGVNTTPAAPGRAMPMQEVDAIKDRLLQLEAKLEQQRKRNVHAPGDARAFLSVRDALGAAPVVAAQTHRSANADNTSRGVDTDADHAATVLEGLSMESAVPFQQHHGSALMRRQFAQELPDTRKFHGGEILEVLEGEGVIDPIAAPKNSFSKCVEHEIGAQCDKTQQPTQRAPVDEGNDRKGAPEPCNELAAAEAAMCAANGGRGPDGCPIKTACQNKGLLKLSSLTESSLGWGLGWALAAADGLGEYAHIRALPRTEAAPEDAGADAEGSRPPVSNERIAVLASIIRTLPSHEQAKKLVDIFDQRVNPFTFSIVHAPTLQRELELFYQLDDPVRAACAVDHIDTCWLGMVLLVFVLALRFEPQSAPSTLTIDEATKRRVIHLWYSAAKTCLVLAGFMGSSSLTVLQTTVLLMFQCSQPGTSEPALSRIALSNAQGMGLHRLGDKSKQPRAGESAAYAVRREIAKRVWWALVVNEWRCASMTMSPCFVHPRHFNTPNNADLLQTPLRAPRPREELTELSLTQSLIELTQVVRKHADVLYELEMKNAARDTAEPMSCETARDFDRQYREVLEHAPIFAQATGAVNGELVEVERWAFQQCVLNKLLQIHRAALSNAQARRCCVELARRTLSLLKDVRARSDLVDLLTINVLQSFSAIILLCLDLMYTPPAEVQRTTVRAEILEALAAMREASKRASIAPRGIRIVEVLLQEEEARWAQYRDKGTAYELDTSTPKNDLVNLALRVARVSRSSPPEDRAAEVPKHAELPGQFSAMSAAPHGTKPHLRRWRARSDVLMLAPFVSVPDEVMQDPELGAFPPLQPTLTSFDPYPMGLGGVDISMQDAANADTGFNLQVFLDSFSVPSTTGEPSMSAPSFGGLAAPSALASPGALGADGMPLLPQPAMFAERAPSFESGSDPLQIPAVPGLSQSDSPTTESSSPNSTRAAPGTMDGFWSWILGQGMHADPNSAPVDLSSTYAKQAAHASSMGMPPGSVPAGAMDIMSTQTPLHMPSLTQPVLPTGAPWAMP